MRDKVVAQRAYYGVRSRPTADLGATRSEGRLRAPTSDFLLCSEGLLLR
jgi:hypothetical protein